jgi:ATP-binding cassette subfamily C protein CydC
MPARSRAPAHRPRILLVDKITSGLDPKTQQMISGVLSDCAGTVPIASHRNETLERMHRVVRIQRTNHAIASPARQVVIPHPTEQ